MNQLPSLERWALLPFLGFSFPKLLLVFLNLFFFRNLYHIFVASVGTFSVFFLFLFFFRYFSVPYFGLACDHGNSFLCLEEEEREGYRIEVRMVFNVKTTASIL